MTWKNSTGSQTKLITDMPTGTYMADFYRLKPGDASAGFISACSTYMRNKHSSVDVSRSFNKIPSIKMRDISLAMGKELAAGQGGMISSYVAQQTLGCTEMHSEVLIIRAFI